MRRAVVALLVVLGSAVHAQTGTIVGRVTDAETDATLPGATVLILEDEDGPLRGAAADADGRYEVSALPAGDYGVRVRALGYETFEARVRIRESKTVPFDAALTPVAAAGAEVVVQARRSATATRADAPVFLVPQAVTVLAPSVLDGQGARSVADALRNVPGATTATQGEPVGVPVLRGFETDQTGGGVRRNGVETPYLFDGLTANVERVEVLRGPASVLYGRLEPGGVVNFITKVPQGQRHVGVEAEGGTLGSGRLAADVGGSLGRRLLGRVNAAAERDGSVRDGVATRTLLLAPALRWRAAPRLTLDADVEAVVADAVLDPGLAVVGGGGVDVAAVADAVPVETFYGEPEARVRWRSLGAFTAAELGLGRPTTLNVTASLSRYGLARDALTLDSLVRRSGDVLVARSLRREDLGFTYLKGAAFLNTRAVTGPLAHAITVGAETVRAWAQADGSAPLAPNGAGGFLFATIAPISFASPAPVGVPRASDRIQYLDATVKGLDIGLFLQDRATVHVGRVPVHVVGSARLSRVTAQVEIFALADAPEAPAGISTRALGVTAVTPAGGIVVEARPGLALYASGGTSFNPIVERVDSTGNPFRPTRGLQAEGGTKLDTWGGRVAGTLAAFWIRKDDALTFGPGGFFYQTGRQQSRGVEAEARGEPVSGLTVLASYAFLDAEIVEDLNLAPGTPLPYAPRHSASLWSEWHGGRWAVRGGVWAEGTRRGSVGSNLQLPAQALVDLGAEAVLVPGVRLRADVRNALGTRGYSAAMPRRGLDGGSLLAVWPTAGREIRIGLVVRR